MTGSVDDQELFVLDANDGRADLARRWFASVVDSVLVATALFMVAVPVVFWFGLPAEDSFGMTLTVYVGFGVVLVPQWILVSRTGQTVGKRWLKIRVVRTDGSLPGFRHGVALRVWPPLVLGLVWPDLSVGFTVVDALFLVTGAGRAGHDYLAGTRVVVASHPVRGETPVVRRPARPAPPDTVDRGPWTVPAND